MEPTYVHRGPLPSEHTDTPVKSALTMRSTIGRMLQAEASERVQKDLQGYTHSAELSDVLKLILTVGEGLLAQVVQKVRDSKLYVDGQWVQFKGVEGLERKYYEPLVMICNSIRQILEDLKQDPIGHWVNHSKHDLRSMNKESAEVRPDCALVYSIMEQNRMNDSIANYSKEIENWKQGVVGDQGDTTSTIQGGSKRTLSGGQKGTDFGQSANDGTGKINGEIEKLRKKQINAFAVWSKQVLTPVEVKTQASEYQKGVKQLFRYIRQTLRDQLDRRFVIGLLLVKDRLYIWMCDRSGAVGTISPINIHKDMEQFIHVIMALHLLPPERLGWDTTMKLYDQVKDEEIPSWEYSVDLNSIRDIYDLRWVFTMPIMENGQPVVQNGHVQRRRYITVDVLSIAAAEVMCGRATITFVVIPYDKRHNTDLKSEDYFVLKQSYRPVMEGHTGTDSNREQLPNEADFYVGVDHPNVAKLVSWEDVAINGVVDSTLRSMRQGLRSEPYDVFAKTLKEEEPRPEPHEQFIHQTNPRPNTDIATMALTDRIYCRLLLGDIGCSVKFFRTKRELVSVLRDIIQGHKYLYETHGVLQRDCSLSNMLIRLRNDTTSKCGGGCIIDLDHAKRGHSSKVEPYPYTDSLRIEKRVSEEVRDMLEPGVIESVLDVIYINTYAHSQINPRKPNDNDEDEDEDNISAMLRMVADYISERIKHLKLPKNRRPYSLQDLKWEVPDTIISFANHRPRRGFRTGTLPFMSHEILSGAISCHTFYKITAGWKQSLVHDAVHDMQSVFWSLLYLCLTRQSGGGVKRDELRGVDADLDLVNIIYCLFDADEAILKTNKCLLFQNFDHMEDYILQHVDKFFEVLKPLLRSWWRILYLAFHYRGFEYWNIHQMFLQAITDFECEIDGDSTKGKEKEKEKEKERKKEQEKEGGDYDGVNDEAAAGEVERRERYLTDVLGMAVCNPSIPEMTSSAPSAPSTPPQRSHSMGHSPMDDEQTRLVPLGATYKVESKLGPDSTPTRKKPKND